MLAGVFSHELGETLTKLVKTELPDVNCEAIKAQVDLTHFAEQYEESVFSLDTLTPHQVEKLRDCEGEGDFHLKAPAGAGKTFVALHRMLKEIAAQEDHSNSWVLRDKPSFVLFVARNPALSYFIARWIAMRFSRVDDKEAALKQLHCLCEPLGAGPRKCTLTIDGMLELTVDDTPINKLPTYSLFVVDEAHHVYRDPTMRSHVEQHVTPMKSQRLLLSDVSQSEVEGIEWPTTEGKETREVLLTEVFYLASQTQPGTARLPETRTFDSLEAGGALLAADCRRCRLLPAWRAPTRDQVDARGLRAAAQELSLRSCSRLAAGDAPAALYGKGHGGVRRGDQGATRSRLT